MWSLHDHFAHKFRSSPGQPVPPTSAVTKRAEWPTRSVGGQPRDRLASRPVRRRLASITAAFLLCGGILAVASPAGATPIPPRPGPKIVGGSQSAPGQFPFTGALVRRGESRYDGFTCGVTVLSRSWVLTAGHCVLDYYDDYPDSRYGDNVAPSYFDVVTGTSSLNNNQGQRINVAAIYSHPSYNYVNNDDDFAVLRLARPTNAAEIAVIGTTSAEQALDDPGTLQTTVGWGLTDESGRSIPADQRYVQVQMNSDQTCANAYPIGRVDEGGFPLEYHASTMLCAGPLAGGQDSCSGDSGGPLAIKAADGSWRQTGVVSFGDGCARANNPGIYSRLTAASSWISRTRRFGPFNPDATAYIIQQYRDFYNRLPTLTEVANWQRTLSSNPASKLILDLQASPTVDANQAAVARLYRAAFKRIPDTSGYAYWVGRRFAGRGPVSIANHYSVSSEFVRKFGNLSDHDFVTQIYQNVFDRDPDPNGRAYWETQLRKGRGRGQMLYELSNSREFRNKTATEVRIITTRYGLLREVPTTSVITASTVYNQRELVDLLRTSTRYAGRFSG